MSAMDIDSGSSKPKSRAIEINADGDNDGTPNSGGSSNNNDDGNDADPIVASYDVYTNPPLPDTRKLLVLQHPNKQGPVRTAYRQIGEVRLKSKSGFIEVDVPQGHGHADYDRDKGLRWGSALARSVAAKNGGTHGLAGGFGVGVPSRGAAAAAAGAAGRGGAGGRQNDLEREISMLDWSEAVRQDKVLRMQTLGGQAAAEKETNCRWMVGVFKGDQLHLTPATSLVHLRPQLHHLDAYAEQERLSRPREGPAAGPSAGAGAGKEGAAAGAASQGGAGTAKAIHMTIKSAGQGDGQVAVDTMVERLRKVQTEPWANLQYEDEYSDKAWTMFSSSLLYAGARKPADKPRPGKGKEKEEAAHASEVEDEAPRSTYKAQWAEDEFLQAVSGLKDNQHGDATLGDDELEIKAEVINQGPMQAPKRAGPAKGKGKAVTTATTTTAPAAASTAKRGARGKSVAFKE
ncbi:hypothetical protein F4804DRAFT_346303 [Jackrogersella minutella]|nr:hypothetical protein F4804DRAFT_346303 [Jackrogersella minutella]